MRLDTSTRSIHSGAFRTRPPNTTGRCTLARCLFSWRSTTMCSVPEGLRCKRVRRGMHPSLCRTRASRVSATLACPWNRGQCLLNRGTRRSICAVPRRPDRAAHLGGPKVLSDRVRIYLCARREMVGARSRSPRTVIAARLVRHRPETFLRRLEVERVFGATRRLGHEDLALATATVRGLRSSHLTSRRHEQSSVRHRPAPARPISSHRTTPSRADAARTQTCLSITQRRQCHTSLSPRSHPRLEQQFGQSVHASSLASRSLRLSLWTPWRLRIPSTAPFHRRCIR